MSTGQRSFKQLAYASVYRPGIDLAVIIAVFCSTVDIVSLFFPWLVGINASYIPGRGLTYTVAFVLSGFEMLTVTPYLLSLGFVPVLIAVLVYFSVKPEGIVPPRTNYKTKARLLILLAALGTFLPTMTFLNRFAFEPMLSLPGVFVSRWELGGGATVPMYAGLGFLLALGLKIMKD